MWSKPPPDPTKGDYAEKPLPFPKNPGDVPTEAPSMAGTEPPGYATASRPPAQFRTTFASMSMHMRDRLRFLHFPPPDLQIIQQTITSTWPKGIQDIRPYSTSHEIKLRGYPWTGAGPEAIHARRLICRILATLHQLGWVLTLSTDISRKRDDKDTLIFRHQDPRPVECEWMCIAFSMMDKIRFIDCPAEIPQRMIERLRRGGAVQSHQPHTVPGSYEVKLWGTPWSATGEESMRAREMILGLLEELEMEGWTVYASVDQKASSNEHVSETDTWHCCRPLNWIRGQPVFHN